MQALGEFYVLNYLGALRQRDFSTCSGEWRAPAALLLIPAAAEPHLLLFCLNIWKKQCMCLRFLQNISESTGMISVRLALCSAGGFELPACC